MSIVALWMLGLSMVMAGYMNPSILKNVKKRALSGNRAQRLLDNMAALGAQEAVVLVDGDNVRGKTSFSISKEQLLSDLHILAEKCGLANKLQLYYDHGKFHEAYKVKQTGVVFSGEKTADDILTRDVAWYRETIGCHVVVITADSGLKSRCHRAARADNKALTIIDSNLFLEAMDAVTINRTSSSSDELAQELEPVSSSPSPAAVSIMAGATSALDMRDLLRLELRLRDQVRSLQRLSQKRSGGRKKRVQFNRRLSEIETRLQSCLEKQQQKQASLVEGVGQAGDESEGLVQSKHVRIDSLDEDTLASVLREESHGRERREETWERCILAERLRKKLLRSLVLPPSEGNDDAPHTFSEVTLAPTPVLPIDRYIKEVNRNYSRTDFEGLILMPTEQARILLCGDDGRSNGGAGGSDGNTDGASSSRPSMRQLSMGDRMSISVPLPSRSIAGPLSTLELRAQRSLREASNHMSPYSQHITSDGVTFSTDHLGCRVFNVSLSGSSSGSSTAALGTPLMKIVCLSDSHAMERALDGLVPSGDVLVHAGDYAGGAGIKSGRGNKNGKKRSRSLDKWLATMPHPVKVVVRGNHDPIMPEFECSDALHYHSSGEVVVEKREDGSVIAVSGGDTAPSPFRKRVRVGISPYGSRAVPAACDIMVSHSPPRGVLDATLSKRKDARGLPLAGKPAGSTELLEAASKQWRAPRAQGNGKEGEEGVPEPPVAWLVGHIHESYGARHFAPWHRDIYKLEGDDGILCINAACANPGPASTLQNLPTVINVYE